MGFSSHVVQGCSQMMSCTEGVWAVGQKKNLQGARGVGKKLFYMTRVEVGGQKVILYDKAIWSLCSHSLIGFLTNLREQLIKK